MRLTQREIDQATYHGRVGTAHYLWDDQIAGFGVRLYLCLVKTSSALILLTFWTPVAILSRRILARQQAVGHSEARTS